MKNKELNEIDSERKKQLLSNIENCDLYICRTFVNLDKK